jgi:hypothetical protein
MNTNPSSLKSVAFNALERLQKTQSTAVPSIHREKPVAYETKAYEIRSRDLLTTLPEEYEERLAITEYDGLQTRIQAERIAYLDAFVSVLVTLPHEEPDGDWLDDKITAAESWLMNQGITPPK